MFYRIYSMTHTEIKLNRSTTNEQINKELIENEK